MSTVFLVQHERRVPIPADVKLIGIYTSRAAAEAAVVRLRHQPGFRELPAGFTVSEVDLDRDHWTEGFGVPSPVHDAEALPLVVCAFCSTSVAPDDDNPVELFVREARSEGEQGLYGHAACLRRAVHPSVPLLTGLPEAEP